MDNTLLLQIDKTKIKLNSRERRILLVTCFGHFMSHFNMLVFPALLLPITSYLHLSIAHTLGLSFWMYLLFGVTALPWGVAADKAGAKPLMLIFYAGAGLSGLSAAMWLDSPSLFALALACLGLFSGIYHPTGLGLISKEVERVSLAMGYNGMFGNLGLAVAPLLAGLFNWLWGIKAAYVAVGLMNFIGLGLTLSISTSSRHELVRAQAQDHNRSLKPFLILLAAMMLGGIAYRGATVMLPAYFELKTPAIFRLLSETLSKSLSTNLVATSITSFIYLIGIIGQYTGGRIAERYQPKYCYLIFHSAVIPTAFLISLVSNIPLVGLTMIYFFFLLGMQPIENTLVASFTPKRFHHSAFGMKFILTFGVGSLSVKMLEYIQGHWGIESTFRCLGLVSVALVIIIVVLLRVIRKR
ncbi:MAG: MFS transporter [Deltaproteobacteria bacterium]|nr:MFS transporter [Deltaproteobacteria bacterium]MBW1929558.1 MFS transporter [Deltaproteobacteria bacterium]MBW2026606.1 MFS transporter [Deltaproteobacteria bacterium]MBW2127047.1 MFS transporter [Deltaproteobacteria bacterium]